MFTQDTYLAHVTSNEELAELMAEYEEMVKSYQTEETYQEPCYNGEVSTEEIPF